jgi:protein gp37
MAENSRIEWTDHTFNPWMGCTKVSAGCKNCYAENQMDHRWNKVQWGPGKPRVRTSAAMWRKLIQWNAGAEFFVACEACGMRSQRRFGGPYKGLSPCPNEECKSDGQCERVRPRVFSASLGDWLDPEVPTHWLADFLDAVDRTPHIDWLLLTKRPEHWSQRLLLALGDAREAGLGCERTLECWIQGNAPKNVWIGTSVEDQEAADKRITALLKIPAAVRFLSCEPLLGPVEITRFTACPICHGYSIGDECDCDPQRPLKDNSVDWVICGGESGPNARPMHPDWARGLRDQCQAAGVPFFFKQWGEWAPTWGGGTHLVYSKDGRVVEEDHNHPDAWKHQLAEPMARVGKKAAGRLLDGREWNEVPEVSR